MAKSEKIRGATNRLLKEGEEIRAVGQFFSGWSPLVGIILAAIGGAFACFTFGISLVIFLLGVLVSAFATKVWYVSITNKRVIFMQLSFWGTPDFDKLYSVPLTYVRLSENRLLVQPVSSDLPQSFHFYFGAKSITGLDKSNFILALTRSASDSQGQNIAAQPVAVQQPHTFLTAEQQEERHQRKRRNWGWIFVIGSGLFALIGVCQTIGAIVYSVSPSAAEAVQENGMIAIIAPLGCNGLWLVVWGVLLGLSIRNLRSVLRTQEPVATKREMGFSHQLSSVPSGLENVEATSQQVHTAKETGFVQRCLKRKFKEKDETRDWTSNPEFAKIVQSLGSHAYQDVCTTAEKLISDFNDLDLLYAWWGEALAAMKAYDQARHILKQGLERSNRKFVLCYTLGDVEMDAGNLEEAVYWWVQALHCQETLEGHGDDGHAYLYLYYVADEMKLSTIASRFLLYADWIQPGQMRLSSTVERQLRSLVRTRQTSDIREVLTRISERYLTKTP